MKNPTSRRLAKKRLYNREYMRLYRKLPQYRKYAREYQRNYRKLDKSKAYKLQWKKDNHYKDEYSSIKRHPKKKRAREVVRREILAGRLKRGKCKVCGKSNADAHHGNYNKPLKITWLCRPCHGVLHRKYK